MALNMWTPGGGDAPMAAPYVPQQQDSFQPAPDFVGSPPNGPEETKQREGGWAKVQAFMQNPDMQMGLLRMGLMMMQPVQPGQTTAGHVAGAIGGSVDYLGAVQQQRQQMQLREAQMKQAGATTEHTQAQTRITIPAEAKRTTAVTRGVEAATDRAVTMLPYERDEAIKKLALLDHDIRSAPDKVAKIAAERKKLDFDNELSAKYGENAKIADLAKEAAYTRYLDAHSAAQKALEDKYKQDASKGKGWRTSSQSTDKDTGDITTTSTNQDTGEMQLVRRTRAHDPIEARALAKVEIKGLTDKEYKEMYPGVKQEDAIRQRAEYYQRSRTIVENMPAPGQAKADTGRGGGQPTGATPLSPKAKQPLPPSMEKEPDGATIKANPGTEAFAISETWVKKGNVLVPATEQDTAKATTAPAATKETPPGSSVGGTQNVPEGVTPEIAQRYSRRVRGGGLEPRFDHEAYNADKEELRNIEADPKLAKGGRANILRQKLGMPIESDKKAPMKLSMKVKRGSDGKLAGIDVEES